MLYTAYEPRRWPPEVLRHFGRAAGIAVRTRAARVLDKLTRESGLDSVAGCLAAAINRHDSAVLSEVKAEAESILRPALEAYAAVRGDGPSVAPKGDADGA